MRWVLVLGVCAGVLAFGGCGRGDDSASTAASTTQDTTATTTPQPAGTQVEAQAGGKSKQAKGPDTSKGEGSKQQSSADSSKHLTLVKVPAISSAPKAGSKRPAPGVKTVKGGDNSVQEYGVEADESQRTEAAIALQGYLNARAQEDWGAACSYLAKRPLEQLERLQDAAAKQGKELGGCAATMAFLKEGPSQLRAGAQITEVLSFRGEGDVSGDPSYLLFSAPPASTLYSMPMYLQAGAWKVGLAKAAELPLG